MPWDDWAGVGRGHLTPRARRLAVLAGSSWSFDTASVRLKEFCGLSISDQTIRRVTEATGAAAQRWMHEAPEAAQAFQEREGEGEFYTDGTSVNTRSGWREMRLGVFAKRPAGEPVEPSAATDWRRRKLPATTARAAFCEIADCESFGERWAPLAEGFGWPKGEGLRCYADGAKWIWRQVRERLPRSDCTVDIFHVSEHIHACGRVLYGEKTESARQWAEQQIEALICTNPVAVLERLEELRSRVSAELHRKAIDALRGYLAGNMDGLWYRDRLRRGQPIGGGLVEGACKTIVGRRLKLNSARWLAGNAGAVGVMACLLYDDRWAAYWNQRAA